MKSKSKIASKADEVLETVLSVIARGIRGASAEAEMDTAATLLAEQCGIGHLRARDEVRAAMHRRATRSTVQRLRAKETILLEQQRESERRISALLLEREVMIAEMLARAGMFLGHA